MVADESCDSQHDGQPDHGYRGILGALSSRCGKYALNPLGETLRAMDDQLIMATMGGVKQSFAFDTLRHDHTPKPEDTRKSRPPSALAASSSVLVMKYFMSHEADVFRREVLQPHFHFVKAEKMDASRKESREQFWICIGFKGRRPAQSQEQAEL